MKLVVGLGNPGSRYARTRHNIGQRVVEELARRLKGRWKESKTLQCRWMEGEEKGIPFRLAIPGSFMNESGEVVQGLVEHFKIHFPSDLLIVADEVMLPFGRLRIRAEGSDGGHRGLRSIEAALGSKEYARLRVGTGPSAPVGRSLEKYVLERFKPEEEKKLGPVLERAQASCLLWITEPLEKVTNATNQLSPPV